MEKIYDMIIIGGGPGGYTAALYAVRAGLDTLVFEKMSPGGQMALTEQLDNYPGFENGIEGYMLAMKMQAGAARFGVVTRYADVKAVNLSGDVKELDTTEGKFYARTVAVATGANPRKMGVAGEDELMGRGVHYCAACDGMFYKGKTVVVVGGGNTAAADALVLSRICEKVILVHRRDSLKATKVYHEPLMKAENIELHWNSRISELVYDDFLKAIKISDVKSGEMKELSCDGIFVSIGRNPASELVKGQLELDDGGYIVADESTVTRIPGVFAVGDVRTKALRQVVTAVADGAVAAHYAEEYLSQNQ